MRPNLDIRSFSARYQSDSVSQTLFSPDGARGRLRFVLVSATSHIRFSVGIFVIHGASGYQDLTVASVRETNI